jgi:MFS transporter, ACS family, D-galactonate transporter
MATREPTESDAAVGTGRSATIVQILRQRSAWGTFGGLFAYNYVWYFFITWLPTYLTRERHFSLQEMSTITGLVLLILAATALISGWASDRWIAAGASPTKVRKTFTGAGPLIASVIVLVGIVGSHRLAVGILIVTCVGLGLCTSNLWAVTQTLAGPSTSGKWTGLQNFGGNLAGWITPAVIGLIVDRTGSFFWAFVITAVVSVLGSLSWIFLVGPLQPVFEAEKP